MYGNALFKRDFENIGINATIYIFHEMNYQLNSLHPDCVLGVVES